MNVEVRHLRALVALAESDTFTTAAAILGTTQPTLSRTIIQLEQTTGVRLVDRTTREMSFTPAGKRFAQAAAHLLTDLDTALAQIHDDAPLPLRLGWAWAGFGRHTVPLLQQWKQAHGGTVHLTRPEDPVQALGRDEIDAALIRGTAPPAPVPADLVTMTLFCERLVAAVPADDPRAQWSAVTLPELATSTVAVCTTAPTATRDLWAHHGRTPRTIRVANTDEWLTRISMGDAVGVTAEATTYNHHPPNVAYLAIEDAPLVEAALAWQASDPHPQANTFAQFARDYFARLIETSTPPFVLTASDADQHVP